MADKFERALQHLAPATITNKTRILKLVREAWPADAKRQLGKIKPSEVVEFLTRYPGIASYNQALETLRAMFALAENDGMISKSPAAGLKQRKRETPIRLTPTTEQFVAIVAEIRNQPFSDTAEESADFLEFLGLAGLGQAEASALVWPEVNFQRMQVVTFRHKTRSGFAIPIYPQLLPLLERRYARAKKQNGGKSPPPNQKVLSVADVKKALSSACIKLGLPPFSQRAFRRMFITTAIERGVDVKVIAQWQGHKDGGKLILDTYSHVRPAHSERMAQLMASNSEVWDAVPRPPLNCRMRST